MAPQRPPATPSRLPLSPAAPRQREPPPVTSLPTSRLPAAPRCPSNLALPRATQGTTSSSKPPIAVPHRSAAACSHPVAVPSCPSRCASPRRLFAPDAKVSLYCDCACVLSPEVTGRNQMVPKRGASSSAKFKSKPCAVIPTHPVPIFLCKAAAVGGSTFVSRPARRRLGHLAQKCTYRLIDPLRAALVSHCLSAHPDM